MMMSDQQIAGLGALPSRFDEVDKLLSQVLNNQAKIIGLQQQTLDAVLRGQVQQVTILQQILDAVVEPPSASKFVISQQKQETKNMSKKKATGIDLQILVNGTGIATISGETDAAGNPVPAPAGQTIPAWSSTNPAALEVIPAADGMSATVTGLAEATGVVLTATATYVDANGVTQTVTGSGDPIDISPAPAGAASTFVISESAN